MTEREKMEISVRFTGLLFLVERMAEIIKEKFPEKAIELYKARNDCYKAFGYDSDTFNSAIEAEIEHAKLQEDVD
jgi:hypothetical protein